MLGKLRYILLIKKLNKFFRNYIKPKIFKLKFFRRHDYYHNEMLCKVPLIDVESKETKVTTKLKIL